ncbi:MAG: hypothetical protein A3J29_08530 [Acidobacteria bacterium RIFCSPLOWO2_12_FULL_67_14b]|nr:MAG: hypothetical protein A3J29_08530 [Acidobacteria bacterium RIFCSPLOWO2_12_FULL_67_14b]
MVNSNYFMERLLLKRCATDDVEAQQRFASTSYRNQVYKTAAEVNRSYNLPLGTDELIDLCKVLVARIYLAHATLPSWKHNLYRRIEDFVVAAVVLYLSEVGR